MLLGRKCSPQIWQLQSILGGLSCGAGEEEEQQQEEEEEGMVDIWI